MKKTIFLLLISLVVNAYYLPKYKSIRPANKAGIVYLNATEFNLNENIYIQINSHNSRINSWIRYDFSDDENFNTPLKLLKPASTWSSSTSVNEKITSFTNKGCYEILRNTSKKFLFLELYGYEKVMDDDYLEIENTKINWGKFWPILIIIVISLGFLIIFGCFIYLKFIRNKCRKHEIIPLNQNQSEYNDSNNNPDNKVTVNPDFNNNCNSNNYTNYTNYNSNNEYNTPQQQNIYYEPTKSAIDNSYGYYSGQKIN